MTEWTCQECGFRRSSPASGNCMCGGSFALPSEEELDGAEAQEYDRFFTPTQFTLKEALLVAGVLFGPIVLVAIVMVLS